MSQWALKLCRLKSFLSILNSTPIRLVLFFVLAVSITLVISDNSVIADVLLQSPASPVEQPPADQPPPSQEQPQQPAPEQSESQPQTNEPVTEIVSPVSPIEAETVVVEPLPIPPVEPQPYQSRLQDETAYDDEASGESNFVLDQAELIDTVVVSTAYVWLCCGFMLLLLIPLVFIFLQIRGRSKILKEETL